MYHSKRPISMYQTRKGQYLHVCTTVKGQYLCTTPRKANIYVLHQERPISICMYQTRKGQYLYTCMYQTRKGQYLHACTKVKGQYLHVCTTVKGQYLYNTPRRANIYVPQEEKPISMYHWKKGQCLCTCIWSLAYR